MLYLDLSVLLIKINVNGLNSLIKDKGQRRKWYAAYNLKNPLKQGHRRMKNKRAEKRYNVKVLNKRKLYENSDIRQSKY